MLLLQMDKRAKPGNFATSSALSEVVECLIGKYFHSFFLVFKRLIRLSVGHVSKDVGNFDRLFLNPLFCNMSLFSSLRLLSCLQTAVLTQLKFRHVGLVTGLHLATVNTSIDRSNS